MSHSVIFPEACYKYVPFSMKEVTTALANNTTITGRVENVISKEEIILVRIGDNLIARMPFAEASIYPYTSTNLTWLSGKNIRVKIVNISDTCIVVSRRANMREAIEHLKSGNLTTFHVTYTNNHVAYGDVGAGIKGCILRKDVSRTHVRNIQEYIHTGDIINVELLEINDKLHFMVSYKNAFMPYMPEDYKVGSKVVGKVADWFKGTHLSGTFIAITPQVYGVMKSYSNMPSLKYGTNVECVITGVTKSGLQLDFLKVL